MEEAPAVVEVAETPPLDGASVCDGATPVSPAAGFVLRAPTEPTLTATFDGGQLTGDGGLPWLAQAEAALGVCAGLAACVPEWRRP